jgi:hypothetical protein
MELDGFASRDIALHCVARFFMMAVSVRLLAVKNPENEPFGVHLKSTMSSI